MARKATSIKGLGSLKTVVRDANIALAQTPKPAPRIGKIGASKLMSIETVRSITTAVKELIAALREHYEILGATLTSEEDAVYEVDEIAAEEEQLRTAILETMEGRPREVVILAAVEAMVEFYPRTVAGVEHFANHAVAIGFLRPLKDGEKKFSIELPVVGSWTQLASDIANSTAVLGQVLAISTRVAEDMKKLRGQKLANLKAGTGNFLEVLGAGTGTTVCFVPGGKNNDNTFPATYLALKFDNGFVTVTDAAGTIFVEKLIGFWIPISSLQQDRFSRETIKGLEPDQVNAMAAVRHSIADGIAYARAQRDQVVVPITSAPTNLVPETSEPAATPSEAQAGGAEDGPQPYVPGQPTVFDPHPTRRDAKK